MTYLLFRSATVSGAPNQLLSDVLFGVPLGAHWLSGGGLLSVPSAVFLRGEPAPIWGAVVEGSM